MCYSFNIYSSNLYIYIYIFAIKLDTNFQKWIRYKTLLTMILGNFLLQLKTFYFIKYPFQLFAEFQDVLNATAWSAPTINNDHHTYSYLFIDEKINNISILRNLVWYF